MTNAVVVTSGQENQAGDLNHLFYKVFAGEVFVTFKDNMVMDGKQMEKTISSGKSAGFNALGQVSSGYHTPGHEILGQNVNFGEIVITVDGLLYADVFTADIYEAMNHYDTRGPLAEEMGYELALQYDGNSLKSVVEAARGGPIVADGNGGSRITNAGMGTTDTVIADAFWAAAELMTVKNINDQRWGILAPAQYYIVARNKDLLNADWGGRGSYADADLPVIAGIPVEKCNHLPMTDDTLDTAIPAKYRQDYSQTRGVIFTPRAAGVVKLINMSMERARDARRQGDLMIAKYACGHGPLRSDCAIELAIS